MQTFNTNIEQQNKSEDSADCLIERRASGLAFPPFIVNGRTISCFDRFVIPAPAGKMSEHILCRLLLLMVLQLIKKKNIQGFLQATTCLKISGAFVWVVFQTDGPHGKFCYLWFASTLGGNVLLFIYYFRGLCSKLNLSPGFYLTDICVYSRVVKIRLHFLYFRINTTGYVYEKRRGRCAGLLKIPLKLEMSTIR